MLLKRAILEQLVQWKHESPRLPLILVGARQVGKTSLLKYLGETQFRKAHYFNFESSPQLSRIFDDDLTPLSLLDKMSLQLNETIRVQEDLIILDEIQACPRAITCLKYFAEDPHSPAVAAAGSLLGISFNEKSSFPVGKIRQIEILPLNFHEFLLAMDRGLLAEKLRSQEVSEDLVHNQLWDLWKQYLVTGGMPTSILAYRQHAATLFDRFAAVRTAQDALISQYINDFSKYAGKVNALHLERIFRHVPSYLAKAHDDSVKRFRFSGVVPGISAYSRLVSAFDWLAGAGLIYRVPIVDSAIPPLTAHVKENLFKVYLFDIGLLTALGDLSPKDLLSFSFGTYKGYLAENYVLQQIRFQSLKKIYGWNENTSEVEFVFQHLNGIRAIEVKAGRVTQAKSLANFMRKYKPTRSYIFGATKPRKDKGVYRLPIYAAGLWDLETFEITN